MLAAERERIAALVEMLINILDQGDGDTDFEPDCNFEADYAEMGIADLDALALYQQDYEEWAAALEARLQAERRRMIANAIG